MTVRLLAISSPSAVIVRQPNRALGEDTPNIPLVSYAQSSCRVGIPTPISSTQHAAHSTQHLYDRAIPLYFDSGGNGGGETVDSMNCPTNPSTRPLMCPRRFIGESFTVPLAIIILAGRYQARTPTADGRVAVSYVVQSCTECNPRCADWPDNGRDSAVEQKHRLEHPC